MLTTLRARTYGDFLMPSRLDLYAQLLESALEAGYRVSSLGCFWRRLDEGELIAGQRYLVLRHDVDTDPRTAADMWDIDRGLGIKSSYFFRLSTLDLDLMARIADGGGEASYHYEELAALVKRRGLNRPSDALAHLPEARDRFAENLRRLRVTTGLPMRVVASHGDFVNRRLGIPNSVILDDPEFRRLVAVDLEAYDATFLQHLPRRYTDAPPPRFWEPADPAAAIAAGAPVISVLVHPRHWRTNWRVNARDDLGRIVEGLRYEIHSRHPEHPVKTAMRSRSADPDRRPRVAMALYGDLTFDSRVRREARTLAEAGYEVTIVCLASREGISDLPETVKILVRRPQGAAIIPGSTHPLLTRRRGRVAALHSRLSWLRAYAIGLRNWGRLAIEAAGPVDLWHAHDLTGLAAIVPNLDRRMLLIYDSHELFLDSGAALRLPGPLRLVLRAYERRLVSRTAVVVTVNEALASVLRRRIPGRTVFAVHNCPARWSPPTATATLLNEAAGVPADAVLVLYHGALSAERGVEQLMDALLEPGLEEAHLVLLGSGELHDRFVRATTDPRWARRVHVVDPVLPTELLTWVASATVGAMPIQPTTLNHRLSTPNKLFECLAAGVPVVASDFPAMRHILLENPDGPLGAVCDPQRVEAIADAIRSITQLDQSDKDALRERCLRAAAERWNWEREGRTLVAAYESVLPRRSAVRPNSEL